MTAEYAFVFWDLARCRSRAWLRSSPRPCCQMCPTLSRSRSRPTTSKGRVGYLGLSGTRRPQTVQTASPVCGTKNFVSVRLYSAPQLHRTIVAILGICPCGTPDQPQCPLPQAQSPLPLSPRKPPPRASYHALSSGASGRGAARRVTAPSIARPARFGQGCP